MELREKAKDNFKKKLSKMMNNSAFGKAMENVGKHRGIKFMTTEVRRDQVVSKPNYYWTRWFS